MTEEIMHRLANLLSIKSLMTLAVMTVFVVLALQGRISSDVVMGVVTMVTAFYFGTQYEKPRETPSKEQPEKQSNIKV